VYETIFDAWGGLAAGIGPPLVLACVWKRTSRPGVIVGMIVGVLVFQLWTPLMHVIDGLAVPDAPRDKLVSAVATNINSTKLVTTVLLNLALIGGISLIWPGRPGPVTTQASGPGCG
jgi:Na+/proline symporter